MRYPKVIFPSRIVLSTGGAIAAALLFSTGPTQAQAFNPGDILVSLSTYQDVGQVAGLQVGDDLPNSSDGVNPYIANADGNYGQVFNNLSVDANFGVTSDILLDEIDPMSGALVAPTFNLTDEAAAQGIDLTTSFSSKSELALNLSTDGSAVTLMGYAATAGELDVSNSNTPGIIEPGNYETTSPTAREIAQLDSDGTLSVTTTNAFAGENGRAAILDSADGDYLAVGNAGVGNGSPAITAASGVQFITPGNNASTVAPDTTPVGSFSVAQTNSLTNAPYATSKQLGKDNTAKDNNYRGETVFDNTLYVTKGSGSNGIDTVYQVGASGSLPTAANAANAAITVLPGLPAGLARNIVVGSTNTANGGEFYPFGVFFANPVTLYVSDEGSGNNTTSDNPSLDPNAGLEKWSLNTTTGIWGLDYTLQAGLGIGQAESISGNADGYTTNVLTDGLDNITGVVNANGTVTIYGVTSTVANAAGDPGADPNEVVDITDSLADMSAAQASSEGFNVLEGAQYGTVYRGVTPTPQANAVPEASSLWLLGLGLAPLALAARRRKAA